jgi:regulator of sigma E protease
MEYFFGFVLLLGVLVFIHELGHFLVAKYFGVRVETFSIGMGKKIYSFRRGETEYVLSLFPLGGYVKLTGQDPREEVPTELNDRSFRTKPLYQRAAVVLAGPLANALLAIGVFFFLYIFGVPSAGPVLERVLPGSPTEKAGLQSGDKVVRIKNTDNESFFVRDLSDLEKVVTESPDRDLVITVERKDPITSKIQIVDAVVKTVNGEERDSTLGVIQKRSILPGVERNALGPIVHSQADSWGEKKGLPSFFWISKIGLGAPDSKTLAHEVTNFENLSLLWAHYTQLALDQNQSFFIQGQKIEFKDDKSNETKNPNATEKEETLSFQFSVDKDFPRTLDAANLLSSETVIIGVSEKSPAEKMGLQVGDRVLSLNSEPFQSFSWFKNRIQEISKDPNATVEITWLRSGRTLSGQVTPHQVEAQDPLTEVKKNQFQVGAAFLALPAPPTMVVVKAEGLFDALGLGWSRTVRLTGSMLSSFYHLAVGDISPKTLGGPLLIAKVSGESIKQGPTAFFKMMAFISLNLFILNLFPIPVLDGGHLVLYLVEAIRRKPLSIKIIEMWTTAGFFLLMGLVAVVFFNDLSRLGLFRFFKS